MRPTRMTAALCLAIPALALGACGGGNEDEDQITEIINAVGENPTAVCDHLAAATLEAFGSVEECQKAGESEEGSEVTIDDLSVDGDKATAKITDSDGESTVEFVKEDGDWKVSG